MLRLWRSWLRNLFSPQQSAIARSSRRKRGFRPLELETLEARTVPALVIVPTWDPTITSDPNAATIEATINQAIQNYESAFTNNTTVNILFKEMGTGLGMSQSNAIYPITYTNYVAAITANATSADDAIALAHLPADATLGGLVPGNSTVWLTPGLDRTLGLARLFCHRTVRSGSTRRSATLAGPARKRLATTILKP